MLQATNMIWRQMWDLCWTVKWKKFVKRRCRDIIWGANPTFACRNWVKPQSSLSGQPVSRLRFHSRYLEFLAGMLPTEHRLSVCSRRGDSCFTCVTSRWCKCVLNCRWMWWVKNTPWIGRQEIRTEFWWGIILQHVLFWCTLLLDFSTFFCCRI